MKVGERVNAKKKEMTLPFRGSNPVPSKVAATMLALKPTMPSYRSGSIAILLVDIALKRE